MLGARSMCTGLTPTQADFLAQIPTQVSVWFETTTNGSQIIRIRNQITFRNSRVGTLLRGEGVSTMIVKRNTNWLSRMYTIRTTLDSGLRFLACIWPGVERTGVIVSGNTLSIMTAINSDTEQLAPLWSTLHTITPRP